MALLSSTELRRVESKYAEGITSAAVVKLFKAKGERFSEATLRKYVQLGLLPTSRRVGIRGRHRGSSGLYPAIIVRLANEIKRALEAGQSLEDIRMGTIGLSGEVQSLRRAADQLLDRFAQAIQKQKGQQKKSALKQTLDKHKKALEREIRGLDKFVNVMGQRAKR